ncbi:MAG: hypothetical protein K2F99_00170 [Muribaculaceae bacterium]|nr:hypothetical protein [Muribaculaceae bacterium]
MLPDVVWRAGPLAFVDLNMFALARSPVQYKKNILSKLDFCSRMYYICVANGEKSKKSSRSVKIMLKRFENLEIGQVLP